MVVEGQQDGKLCYVTDKTLNQKSYQKLFHDLRSMTMVAK